MSGDADSQSRTLRQTRIICRSISPNAPERAKVSAGTRELESISLQHLLLHLHSLHAHSPDSIADDSRLVCYGQRTKQDTAADKVNGERVPRVRVRLLSLDALLLLLTSICQSDRANGALCPCCIREQLDSKSSR